MQTISVPQLTPEHIVICHQQLQAAPGTTEFKKCYLHKCKCHSLHGWSLTRMKGALEFMQCVTYQHTM